MEMSYDMMAERMRSIAGMPLDTMGMDAEARYIREHSNVYSRPSSTYAAVTNQNNKRRLTEKCSLADLEQKCPKIQDLVPPVTGHGDTIFVSNPFDDSPVERSQRAIGNVGASREQQMPVHRTDDQQLKSTSAMMPITNVTYPAMSHYNIENMRSMMNHANQMNGYSYANQAPVCCTNPMSNMMHNLSNETMMSNHLRMSQMANIQMASARHLMDASVNNQMFNESINMNNTYRQSITKRPLNVSLPTDNVNEPNGKQSSIHEPNVMGKDVGNPERSMNMKISQQNQMGHLGGPINQSTSNNSRASFMEHHTSQNGSHPYPRLHRALNMGRKSREKIYAFDQPMIFNVENPHGSPIYPCGICHKKVNDNDQGIVCESGCNFWFHRTCLKLSKAAFQSLTQEIYAEWVCDKCVQLKNIPPIKYKP